MSFKPKGSNCTRPQTFVARKLGPQEGDFKHPRAEWGCFGAGEGGGFSRVLVNIPGEFCLWAGPPKAWAHSQQAWGASFIELPSPVIG